MDALTRASAVICMAVVLSSTPLLAQTPSHEEEVVRSTYAALSFLCSLEPVSQAALGQKEFTQARLDREVSQATPVFEITHFQTGTIASIASQNWTTRFSFPDKDTPAVLAGSSVNQGYTNADEGVPGAIWRFMRVHWDLNNSYTPDRIAQMGAVTVGEAVKMGSTGNDSWTVPATYTRYATFEVTLTFQGKTVGPYTATFFFGKDAKGNEVVTPQDAIVSGQLLWDALPRQTAYPADLIRTPKFHQNQFLDRWIQANVSSICSSARSDLCCVNGVCSLPQSAVAKDLAASAPKRP